MKSSTTSRAKDKTVSRDFCLSEDAAQTAASAEGSARDGQNKNSVCHEEKTESVSAGNAGVLETESVCREEKGKQCVLAREGVCQEDAESLSISSVAVAQDCVYQEETQEIGGEEDDSSLSSTLKMSGGKRRGFHTADIAKMAVLTALSYVLYMFVKFPLPFFPSFLDIQISDMPALLAGFALGPAQGCVVILVKCLLKMPFSSTAFIGEIGDILIGIAFVLPAAMIYHSKKGIKTAAVGLTVGSLSAVAVSLVTNRFMLIPFYANVFGFDNLVNMVKGLYPSVTVDTFYNFYLWVAVLPFNLLRCLISGVVTFLVYKPLSKVMHWEIETPKAKERVRIGDVLWQIGAVLCPFVGLGGAIALRKKSHVRSARVAVMTVVGFAAYIVVLFVLLLYFKVI